MESFDEEMMKLAIVEAKKCIPVETAYNVGAVLVKDKKIYSKGFSREIEGNTHAEECCIIKSNEAGEEIDGAEIYTTMEPCCLRLSGKTPCVEHILKMKIQRVIIGVQEPEHFVKDNNSIEILRNQGIKVDFVPSLQNECKLLNQHLEK